MQAPYQVTVDTDRHQFDLTPDQAQSLDLITDEQTGTLHILRDGKAYRAELVEADYANRSFVLKVNGQKFTIHIKDHYERLIQQLGLTVGGVQKQNTLKAPMPGLVLQISAEAGQSVQKGDTLLILEAMKMENVLKAASDGVIKSIHVTPGAAVEKGQLLVEFEVV